MSTFVPSATKLRKERVVLSVKGGFKLRPATTPANHPPTGSGGAKTGYQERFNAVAGPKPHRQPLEASIDMDGCRFIASDKPWRYGQPSPYCGKLVAHGCYCDEHAKLVEVGTPDARPLAPDYSARIGGSGVASNYRVGVVSMKNAGSKADL